MLSGEEQQHEETLELIFDRSLLDGRFFIDRHVRNKHRRAAKGSNEAAKDSEYSDSKY